MDNFRALPGLGVSGFVQGRSLLLGNTRLMTQHAIDLEPLRQDTAAMLRAGQTVSFLAETAPRPKLLAVLGFCRHGQAGWTARRCNACRQWDCAPSC